MRLTFIVLVLIFYGCQYFQPKEEVTSQLLATVGTTKLYLEDLSTDILKDTPDSAVLANKLVNEWIKKQLMIQRARKEININEAEIEKKVLDYQYALIVHDYTDQYIKRHLDLEVDSMEIVDYYHDKSENFVLRENIIRCLYVKIPKDAPGQNKFKRDLSKYSNKERLKEYTNEYAIKAFLEDDIWVGLDEVLIETPIGYNSNGTKFLKSNQLVEVADDEFTYMLKILDYKLIGEIAPPSYVRKEIIDIIINKRKVLLMKDLQEHVYEEAKTNGEFEIFG